MKLTFRPIDQWPGQLTSTRKLSPFDAPWSSTMSTLDRECAHLQGLNIRTTHAKPCVLQLAVPEGAVRQDGQLAAGRADHPGVILNVDTPTGPLRFSCDRFDAPRGVGWKQNLRAIALGLEALRRVERYGMGSGHEQYDGFQALPPATPMGAAPLTREEAISLLGMATVELGARDALRDGRLDPHAAWRMASKSFHPDAGGDPDMFRRLTEARDLLAGNT